MKPALLILIGYGLVVFLVVELDLYQNGPLTAIILAGVGLALSWFAGGMFFKAGHINFWATLAAVVLLGAAILFTDSTAPFAKLGNWILGLLVTAPIAAINTLAACRCLWLRRRNRSS